MEAAANLIVHAAIGHLVERKCRHFERVGILRAMVIPQQEIDAHAGRKFRRAAESAFALGSNAAREGARRLIQNARHR